MTIGQFVQLFFFLTGNLSLILIAIGILKIAFELEKKP